MLRHMGSLTWSNWQFDRLTSTRNNSFIPFICYLAARRPILGLYRGGSITHPMLITAFYLCLTRRSLEASLRAWDPKPGRAPSGVWARELLYHFNHNITMATNYFWNPEELYYFDHQIFNAITQLRKRKKRADIDTIHTQTLKTYNSEMLAGII